MVDPERGTAAFTHIFKEYHTELRVVWNLATVEDSNRALVFVIWPCSF